MTALRVPASKATEGGRPAPAVLAPTPFPAASPIALAWGAFRRRFWPFVFVAWACPVIAGIAVSRLPVRYTATGTLLFDPTDYAAEELRSVLHADPVTDAAVASQADIIRGLPAAEALVARFGLVDRAEFNPALAPPGPVARAVHALRHSVLARLALGHAPAARADPAANARAVFAAVQAAILVTPVRGTRVLSVGFTSADPVLAADAANAVMQRYIDDQLRAKSDAVERANAWLETRLADLRADVRAADDRIAAYRAERGLTQGVQAGLDTEQASRMAADLQQARAELALAEGRVDAARGRSGAASQAAIAPSVVPLRAQQEQGAAALQAALSRLGPNHPEVIALRAQAEEARRAVGAETGRVVAATEAEMRADRARVSALEVALKAAQSGIGANDQARIPLDAMQREADTERSLLLTVLERMQQTSQQTVIERADARVLSAAMPPARPSAPKSSAILGLSGIAGLLIGGMVVSALEAADTTLRGGEDARTRFGLPCLALLPELGRRRLGPLRPEEYAVRKPVSAMAEQLRALRAALWLAGEQGGGMPRSLAVTAARPGEGKTVLTLSLGRAAATEGARVVVVDCDLRDPALGRRLWVGADAGLTDFLLGEAAADAILRTDTLTRMDFIPAGTPRVDSFALLASNRLPALLDWLRERYEIVLLDCPPIVAMADARLIARHADATLLCARWRRTPSEVIGHALDLLDEARARVRGIVLTRVDARVHGRAGYPDSDIYHPRMGGYFRD